MEFNYDWIKDPQVFEVNRLKAHSSHAYYANEEELKIKESSFVYSLNGLWQFYYAPTIELANNGFEKIENPCLGFVPIKVPGHIQLQGYDKPMYVNIMYPWDGSEELTPGEIPVEYNPTGNYVKYFDVPETMKNRPLYISFQGVESAFALWLNGHFVGYSEDSFTPSEFDLTPYLKEKNNKLALQVYKFSSGSWLEDQDFWRFSGIFRDVYLYVKPFHHVEDLRIKTKFENSYETSTLEVLLKMSQVGGASLEISLVDAENHLIFETQKEVNKENLLEFVVEHPQLWSSEDPYLYTLFIKVKDSEGFLHEVISQKVGFREFKMDEGIMKINGQRIVFYGVDRHEFSCVDGRALKVEDMVTDLVNMKRNNINAIRTSHYPNQSVFYDLCDEYGFYVIDETNLETHGSWQGIGYTQEDTMTKCIPNDSEEWFDAIRDRVTSLYQRDKNHPSVVIWSCGNEAGAGRGLYEMSLLFKEYDDTRLVHYEGVARDRRYNDTSDMESQMYTPAKEIEEFLLNDDSKPFILCEYAHAMGNSVGALDKYLELTDKYEKFQGGFIWDYVDQALLTKDPFGNDYYAYGGDFDDRPSDYNFCGNGLVYPDRTNTPKMQEVKYQYQGIAIKVSKDKVRIRNKYLFTNLEKFEARKRIERNGILLEETPFDVSLEPLSEITVPLEYEFHRDGEYAITISFHLKEDTIWAKKGHEIAFGQYVYCIKKEPVKCLDPFEVIDSPYHVGVKGTNFRVLFAKDGKGLTSYRYGQEEMFNDLLKPNFYHPLTDNDRGNQAGHRYGPWLVASLYSQVENVEYRVNGDHFEIDYYYHLIEEKQAKLALSYHVYGDGKVKVVMEYLPDETLTDLPEFGLMLQMKNKYHHLKWYGLGYEDTYCDRYKGAKLGIYKNDVKDNMAKYLMPQECGNHVGVRYAIVSDDFGRGLLFECEDTMEFSALPYTPLEIESASHHYALPPYYHTVIRATLMKKGVGGDNTWGARTHDEYLLKNKQLHFEFTFKGI